MKMVKIKTAGGETILEDIASTDHALAIKLRSSGFKKQDDGSWNHKDGKTYEVFEKEEPLAKKYARERSTQYPGHRS